MRPAGHHGQKLKRAWLAVEGAAQTLPAPTCSDAAHVPVNQTQRYAGRQNSHACQARSRNNHTAFPLDLFLNQWNYINQIQGKGHMIISINTEIALDKSPHPCIIKDRLQIRNRRELPWSHKEQIQSISCKLILTDGILEAFPLRSGMRLKCLSLKVHWRYQPARQEQKV